MSKTTGSLALAPKPDGVPFATEYKGTDDGQVTFTGPNATGMGFSEVGIVPITSQTIGGHVFPSGGTGMTEFLTYNGSGTLHFDAQGHPTAADYSGGGFALYVAQGDGVFGHAADGTPTVSGLHNAIKLASGAMIAGHLDFLPTGGITGSLDFNESMLGAHVGTMHVGVAHAAADATPTATGMLFNGGQITATQHFG